MRVEKPWGYEIIWAQTERYVGKILHINENESLSLQYHEKKDETISVLSGKLKFLYGEDESHLKETTLLPGQFFHIIPQMRHQMIALEESDVLEASTPELEDVVRIKDLYGRV